MSVGTVAPARSAALPLPPSRLIGRSAELTHARDLLLSGKRILTVTGPPGVGKTRFALALATSCADEFADRAAFVPLATVTDPELVGSAIAQALSLWEASDASPGERLTRGLQGREILLVLDNFEQVAVAAPMLADVAAACPGVAMLVTSRERLRLSAEQEFGLGPLETSDAVELFCERALASRPEFRPTEQEAVVVADICRRLDGLPLALELAAPRIRLLQPDTMLARLDRRLELLTTGPRDLPIRQQTLRGAIQWSYDLLDGDERAAFSRLAVFVGGCSLEAAEAVCGISLDTLVSLADKHLLQKDECGGEARVAMLETIREFALARLAEEDDEHRVRVAHAAFFRSLVEEAEPRLTSVGREGWLDRLECEYDNLRAAFWFSLERAEAETALWIAAGLPLFWLERGRFAEGSELLERGLAAVPDAPPGLRARALAGAGLLAEQRGDGVLGEEFFASALAEARASSDARSEVFAVFGLGRLALGRGDAAEARRDCEQSLALCRQLDERWLAAELLEWLGYVAWHETDLARSEELFRQSVGAFRELGDERGAARALEGLGFLAVDRDDRAAAIPLLQEGLVALAHAHNPRERMLGIAGEATSNVLSGRLVDALRLFQEVLGTAELLGNPIIQGQGLIAVADVLAAGGQARPAARLLGAATSCFEAAGTKLQLLERRRYEQARKRTRAALGLEPSDAAEAAGRELTLEQAVEEARRARLGSSDIDPTARELEILRLVATGLSNAEIARSLVVSVRTVHAHLRSIYRKFGVHTRTAAARAAAEKGLV